MNNGDEAQPVHGGGGEGQKTDAVVIENVDNGYIVRVVCAATETEQVLVFTHDKRSDLLHFLASVI